MSEPLLSVCLITYNHAKYIKEAIDGVLMQKVNFTWELIIADDFSIDGTREIVIEYKKKYPDFIKLILQEKNVGAAKNWMDLITNPKSKYIAYFEGDDYWTDPLKLQKQVDFLEENEDYGLVHTDFITYYQKENKFTPRSKKLKIPEGNIAKELLYHNLISSPTVCFRRLILENIDLPILVNKFKIGDYFLWLEISFITKIHYLDSPTSCYRIAAGSVMRRGIKNKIKLIKESILIKRYYINKFKIKFNLIYFVIKKIFRNQNLQLIIETLMKYLGASPRDINKVNAQGGNRTNPRVGVLNPKDNKY